MVVGAAADVAVWILLIAGVASAFVCVAGVLVMRTTFDRLHYASAATTVPAFLILAAVLVRQHLLSGGLAAIGAVGLMFLLQPVLLTATARAARRIDFEDISPRDEEIQEE
jgi:multisubunit Na+/H+ antiporter MnhG subunit